VPKFVRRQKPPVYSDYHAYRRFLRIDFLERCCYCGMRETPDFTGIFHVEHFHPKEDFPALVCTYSNLFYACNRCNRAKWDTWPSAAELAAGERFWNPCEDRSYKHFECRVADGAILPKDACGRYTIDTIRLDRKNLRQFRLKRIERQRRFRAATALVQKAALMVEDPSLSQRDKDFILATRLECTRTLEEIRSKL
jgi:uncharacterized protein (TIGR02646 family)